MVEMREHTVSGATEKMKEGAKEFKEAVTTEARGKFDEYKDEAKTMIQENPYRSVLIAFGVGALIGMMMIRRD
jgi:ElaB/YqjD/DUF883 family membrane-anchored ribosome-binding protein